MVSLITFLRLARIFEFSNQSVGIDYENTYVQTVCNAMLCCAVVQAVSRRHSPK
jgi:hypothetical protein